MPRTPTPAAEVALPSDTQLTPAQRQARAVNEIGRQLQTYSAPISRLLARTGVDDDTFRAQIVNAVRATPDLLGCSTETVIGAALRCAQLGLTPNDVRNLAWILPYGGKAQFQLGYGGVMELARRAVPGLKFDGHAVYPNDEFDLDYGRDEQLKHKPAVTFQKPRGGDAYAWWVRARYPDGTVQIHSLDKEGVEYHRSFSKQKDGLMWTKSYDAAALKSVVTDMKRWLPSSTELAIAFASDGEVIDVRTAEPIEVTHTPHVDTTTGEITTGAPADDDGWDPDGGPLDDAEPALPIDTEAT